MTSTRWSFALVLSAGLISGGASIAAADYPDRPVHLIAGVAAGGGTDLTARIIAKALSDKWHQAVEVENRAGADGAIAENYVAHATPDGYTLLIVSNSFTMPGLKTGYNPATSFAPISLADTKPMVLLVNPSLPVNTVQDLIALAKAKPGQLNFGSDGPTSNPATIMQQFMRRSGIQISEIAYKGGGQSQTAVLGGEVEMTFGTLSAATEAIKAGRLKALAVSSDMRTSTLPDVPTLAEAGNLPGFNEGAWNGFLAPGGTPKAIVDKISKDLAEVLKTPEMKKTFDTQGIQAIATTPDEFNKYIQTEIPKLAAIYKKPDGK